MLPLCRETVVGGDDGPPIGKATYPRLAGVDHRLDGEDHAGLKLEAGRRAAVVKNLRLLVKCAADAVAAKLAYDRIAVRLGVALYGRADVAEMSSRLDRPYSPPHRLVSDLAKPLGLDRRRTNIEHAARVAVKPFVDHGYIDVDDVAGFELLVAGNAVTDDVVDRGADRRRIRAMSRRRVVQRRRDDTLYVDLVVVRDDVDLARADARLDVRREIVEQLRRQPPRHSHFCDLVRSLDRDRHRIHPSHGCALSSATVH